MGCNGRFTSGGAVALVGVMPTAMLTCVRGAGGPVRWLIWSSVTSQRKLWRGCHAPATVMALHFLGWSFFGCHGQQEWVAARCLCPVAWPSWAWVELRLMMKTFEMRPINDAVDQEKLQGVGGLTGVGLRAVKILSNRIQQRCRLWMS